MDELVSSDTIKDQTEKPSLIIPGVPQTRVFLITTWSSCWIAGALFWSCEQCSDYSGHFNGFWVGLSRLSVSHVTHSQPLYGVPTFFPPKIPAKKRVFRDARASRKEKDAFPVRILVSGTSKEGVLPVKSSSIWNREPFLAHGLAWITPFSTSTPIKEWLSGDFGREKCWDPKKRQNSKNTNNQSKAQMPRNEEGTPLKC